MVARHARGLRGRRQFFRNALRQARQGAADMDTLVALSTGISYSFSVFNLLFPEVLGRDAHLYFDSSCGVITFILIGRLLERAQNMERPLHFAN